MMYFIIPAKMTWAMQPCDTHVFARLKDRIACLLQEHMIEAADGKTTIVMLVAAVNQAIRDVVGDGNWRMAFWDLGLTGVQACISDRMLDKLELRYRPHVPNSLPTLAALVSVFPGRAILPIDDMFRLFINRARPPPKQTHAPQRHIVHHVQNSAAPWLGRLRSSTALGSQDSAPEAAPEAWPMPTASLPLHPVPHHHLPPPMPTVPRARRLLPWLPRPPKRPLEDLP